MMHVWIGGYNLCKCSEIYDEIKRHPLPVPRVLAKLEQSETFEVRFLSQIARAKGIFKEFPTLAFIAECNECREITLFLA